MKGEFYKMDFEAWDEGTIDLSLEQEAAYLRLCHQMYRRHGAIPNSKRLLCVIFRCGHTKATALLKGLIQAGKIVLTDDGMLANHRVSKELADREQVSTKRRAAGHQGGTNSGAARRKSLETNDVGEANASTPTNQRREEKRRELVSTVEGSTSAAQIDADYARLQAEIAQAFAEIGNVMPPHPGRARVWLANGFSPDLIISVIREGLARKPDISNLSYFDNRLREAAETKPAEQAAKPAYKPEDVFTDEVWDRAITGWKRTKHWSYGKWSMPPDDPACKIPAHVLAAHGYGKAAA
jgi:uncharacterized protein YdaU (DUF1376 family)